MCLLCLKRNAKLITQIFALAPTPRGRQQRKLSAGSTNFGKQSMADFLPNQLNCIPLKTWKLDKIGVQIQQVWYLQILSTQCGIWYPAVSRYPLSLLQLFSRSNRWLSCRFTIRTRWSHSAWPPRSGQESSQDAPPNGNCNTKSA